MAVCDRDDYIQEAEKQLDDKEVYEEVRMIHNPSSTQGAIEKIRKRGDLSTDNIKFFMVKDPKFVRFFLLPNIHKKLENLSLRPVISNCGFYTENISVFLDFYLQTLVL